MTMQLHFAAQAGDCSEIRRLVAAGADVNSQDEHGNTPLKYASAEPYPDALRTLIALGASPHLPDHRGFTPLHCVAGHGFYEEAIEMATILIDAGADVNARSQRFGFVPLHEARTTGMIDFLLRHGADPCLRNDAGQTPAEYLRADGETKEADHLSRRFAQGWHGGETSDRPSIANRAPHA
jgi:ankyrin repeat protein